MTSTLCYEASHRTYQSAEQVMPDGNTRHTVYFDPFPIYAASAEGCRVTDVDGNSYLDCVNNYSSLIHGHGEPTVLAAVRAQIDRMICVGLPTEEEIRLATVLRDRVESVEEVRFANSGTEAVMLAIKVARSFTGRAKIAKLEGAYHGSFDAAEISTAPPSAFWGSAQRPASVAVAAGTPDGVLENTIVLPFNDPGAARAILDEHAIDLAAVLLDVAPSHVAYLPLSAEFLEVVRERTRALGALLILDEVYSFRYGVGGAQARFNLRPDLTVLGKIIGGGFPVGAVAGSREVMSVFRHRAGPPKLPHGGTYNGNPVTMVAGRAAIQRFDQAAWHRLEELGEYLRQGLAEQIRRVGFPAQITGLSSVAALVMSTSALRSFRDLPRGTEERARLAAFHRGMLDAGILMDPRGTVVLSTPMTQDHIDEFLEKAAHVMRALVR